MPKPPRQLDSRIDIVTPENIAFHYVLAGPFRRLPAYLIDVLLRAMVIVLMALAALFAGVSGVTGLWLGLLLVTWFVLSWFYGGVFETLCNGQTPGKWITGLRVLSVDGRPINALQAVLRNVLRDVDAMPFAFGYGGAFGIPLFMLGLATMVANNRYQRLGDLACGTIVVVERRGSLPGLAAVERAEVLDFARHVPPDFVAPQAMAKALSAYVARRERFSSARRFELANTLAEPLIERLNLPRGADPDLLLCALYYRAFVADRSDLAGNGTKGRQRLEAARA
jgi:uncharacterized RDD family membrane protein YckC